MTMIVRQPATQVLTLNSMDRFQNSSTARTQVNLLSTGNNSRNVPLTVSGSGNLVNSQAWNSFTLQRSQNLMEAFATRIAVTEVRFPWYIPNITSVNNQLWIAMEANTIGNPLTLYVLTLDPGFYTLDQLVTALNAKITATTALNPPTVSLQGTQFVFTPAPGAGAGFFLYWFNPQINPNAPSEYSYLSSPSLAMTLGLTYNQVSGGSNTTQALIGNPTEGLYTAYVDIVSEKLNYYSHTKDGSSSGQTNKSLVCRLYLADEISLQNIVPVGQAPFVIHRQFKNAKNIMWNKEAVIDLLDLSVIDQYGQLVPLPVIAGAQSLPGQTVGAYPDFQITLLASEN